MNTLMYFPKITCYIFPFGLNLYHALRTCIQYTICIHTYHTAGTIHRGALKNSESNGWSCWNTRWGIGSWHQRWCGRRQIAGYVCRCNRWRQRGCGSGRGGCRSSWSDRWMHSWCIGGRIRGHVCRSGRGGRVRGCGSGRGTRRVECFVGTRHHDSHHRVGCNTLHCEVYRVDHTVKHHVYSLWRECRHIHRLVVEEGPRTNVVVGGVKPHTARCNGNNKRYQSRIVSFYLERQ